MGKLPALIILGAAFSESCRHPARIVTGRLPPWNSQGERGPQSCDSVLLYELHPLIKEHFLVLKLRAVKEKQQAHKYIRRGVKRRRKREHAACHGTKRKIRRECVTTSRGRIKISWMSCWKDCQILLCELKQMGAPCWCTFLFEAVWLQRWGGSFHFLWKTVLCNYMK